MNTQIFWPFNFVPKFLYLATFAHSKLSWSIYFYNTHIHYIEMIFSCFCTLQNAWCIQCKVVKVKIWCIGLTECWQSNLQKLFKSISWYSWTTCASCVQYWHETHNIVQNPLLCTRPHVCVPAKVIGSLYSETNSMQQTNKQTNKNVLKTQHPLLFCPPVKDLARFCIRTATGRIQL